MRHDDAVSASRVSHAQELELRQLRQTETVTAAAIAPQRELLDEARAYCDRRAARVALETSEQLAKAEAMVEMQRHELANHGKALVAKLMEAGIGWYRTSPAR